MSNNKYSYEHKLKVVKFYIKNGLKATANYFAICQTMVLTWYHKYKSHTLHLFDDNIRNSRRSDTYWQLFGLNKRKLIAKLRIEDRREQSPEKILGTKFRYLLLNRVLSGKYKISARFGKRVLCVLLNISRNGYLNWIKRNMPIHSPINKKIMTMIIDVRKKYDFYGWRRIQQEIINTHNTKVSKYLILKYLRYMKLSTRQKGYKRIVSKNEKMKSDKLKNLLVKDGKPYFKASYSDQIYCSDVICFKKYDPSLYLFCIIDLFDHRIVAFTWLQRQFMPDNVYDFVKKLLESGMRCEIWHSDWGNEQISQKFHNLITSKKWTNPNGQHIKKSYSWKAKPWTDSPIENFFGLMSWEVNRAKLIKLDNESIKHKITNYINFWNYERINSSLGYKKPIECYKKPIDCFNGKIFFNDLSMQKNHHIKKTPIKRNWVNEENCWCSN